MGAMEKKRLLPALIAAVIAASGTVSSLAEDLSSLRGVRDGKRGKRSLRVQENFWENCRNLT